MGTGGIVGSKLKKKRGRVMKEDKVRLGDTMREQTQEGILSGL